MPNAPAARVTDQVQHSEAKTFRRVGMGLGALVGIGIGAFLVVASGAVEVLSAGTLTPVAALGVYVGAALVVGGTAAATGAAVSNSAADMGKSHKEEDGPILTGVTTIYIGADRQMAAHTGSKVACKRHKHSPPDDVELVAQGSSTVLLGPGHDPAARIGDLGTCKFSIGQGCSSVIIGGKTTTRYKIVDGDDPEKALFNEIGKYGGYAALIGGALIAIPIAAAGSGLLMGLKTGAMLLGKGLAMSQGIAWAVNKIPNEELRDHVNTVVALVLPFIGHDKGPAEETPAGGSDPPAPANDNVPGGGRPPEPANDNNAGTGKPPEPANDNNAGGSPPAPGETAQQIGTHEGGAPGDAPPDDAPSGDELPAPANDNTPGGDEPPTPASDNAPGKAGETAETASSGEPTEQTGSSDGGAPGEAPPEQAEDGSAEEGSKEAAAGEADPTVQTKDSPGGHTDETDSDAETSDSDAETSDSDAETSDSDAETSDSDAETAAAKKWGVTWFNEKALAFTNKPDAFLGAPGGLSWFMPGEDAAGLRSVADVARETGMAPGAAEAFKTGGRIFGLSFPLDGIQSRLPVAADAGFNADGTAESWANPNWLDGGHTAVRVGEVGDPNGSYLVNPTHEFVTDGGNPMPPGAVLFELGPNGSWMPIRRF